MAKKTKKGKTRLDKYYNLAKQQGYRSRAAFKLVQLNRKFDFLSTAQCVLDLCAAPGGWMQVALKHQPVKSICVGVDLDPIKPVGNAISIQDDITTASCRAAIKEKLMHFKCDVVLHDGAPNVGAEWARDAYSQSELTLSACKLACEFLREKGWFVTKVFRSTDYNALLWVFRQLFGNVIATKPAASRSTSAEIFVVCKDFKAPSKIDPKFFDPKFVFNEIDVEPLHVDLFNPKQKKRSRDGYAAEYTASVVRKTATLASFVESDDPETILGTCNELIIDGDDASIRYSKYPDTPEDFALLCNDLQVLGKKDFKTLLKWRKKVLASKEGESDDDVVSDDDGDQQEGAEEGEENPDDMLEKEILDYRDRQEKKEKRAERKVRKEASRLQRDKDRKMVAPKDLAEQEEEDLFSLRRVDGDVDVIGDALPNVVVDASDDEKRKIVGYGFQSDEESEISDRESGKTKRIDDIDEYIGHTVEQDVKRASRSKRRALQREKGKERAEEIIADREMEEIEMEIDRDGIEEQFDSEFDDSDDSDSDSESGKKRGGVDTFGGNVKKAKRMKRFLEKAGDEEGDEDDNNGIFNRFDSDSDDSDGEDEMEKEYEERRRKHMKKPQSREEKAEFLALAKKMHKQGKESLKDASYHRYSYNDDGPSWLLAEEKRHYVPQRPITKEEVSEFRRAEKEINSRSTKKVLEAKRRKMKRASRRIGREQDKVAAVLDNPEASKAEKMKSVEKLRQVARGKTNTRPKKKYVVSRSFNSGDAKGAKEGGARVKRVDPRMKKDLRSQRSKNHKAAMNKKKNR